MEDRKKRPGLLDFLDTTTKLIAAVTALLTATIGLTTVLVRMESGSPPVAEAPRDPSPGNAATNGPPAGPAAAFTPPVVSAAPIDTTDDDDALDDVDWRSPPAGPGGGYVPQPQPYVTQILGGFCCDMAGFRRCPLVAPLVVGSACFCPYQGQGFVCQ
jgi:hypothetical protein